MTHSFPTRRSSDLTRVVSQSAPCAESARYSCADRLGLFGGCSDHSIRNISVVADRFIYFKQQARDSYLRLFNFILGAFQQCRSEEHTSELQSLMRISYAVFCLKKKKQDKYK